MTGRRVGVIGAHSSPFSGAAIVHDQLAARLAGHLPDDVGLDDVRLGRAGLARRIAGTGRRSDVAVVTSTPLPLRPPGRRVLPIVYDVRWRWTRPRLDRAYRHVDLWRTARRATHVFTISHTVAEQLRAMRLVPAGGVTVLELGPGQFESYPTDAATARDPSVLLIGAAAHKRNELAAELLGRSDAALGDHRIVAISVSDQTASILRRHFPPERLEIIGSVTPEQLADHYRTSRHYLALGVSEGFGLPYIEAAYFGCDVIAPRQAVTLEVLGEDANLLATADPDQPALEAALRSCDRDRVARLQQRATQRSWDRAADQVASIVIRHLP